MPNSSFLKFIFLLVFLSINLFLSTNTVFASDANPGNFVLNTGYYDSLTNIPSNLQTAPNCPKTCDVAGTCANSHNLNNCSQPTCDGGNDWTKYNVQSCKQLGYDPDTDTLSCKAIYTQDQIVYSIGDKCESWEQGLRSSSCTSQESSSMYKTCCSYPDANGRSYVNPGSCVQFAGDGINPPWEGMCPAGYGREVFCSGSGCGQAACGELPGCTSDGSCSATPLCGQTASGTDNCGNSCTKTGEACTTTPGCPYDGDTCTYSETDGKCYSGTGGSGFNPSSGCLYSCGPVPCPTGGSQPTPPPWTSAPVTGCQVQGWGFSDSNPLPNTEITVTTYSNCLSPGYNSPDACSQWPWNNVGFKVDNEWTFGPDIGNEQGYYKFSKIISSKYPGTHSVDFLICESPLTNCHVCTPDNVSFTTRSYPKPNTPTVAKPSCINAGYASNGVTISWDNSIAVSQVQISTSSSFGSYASISVSGSSVTGPSGFSNSLKLNPGTDYFVRTYNGDYSNNASFNIPPCLTLSGKVTDENGIGIGGVIINGGYGSSTDACVIGTKTTSADGSFSFSNIPPGQAFCMRGPTTGVSNHTLISGGYECQKAGGYYNPDACNNSTGSDIDLTSDNLYNFIYTSPCPPSAGYPTGGIGACGGSPQLGYAPASNTIDTCSSGYKWEYNPGPAIPGGGFAYNRWCAVNTNPDRGYCYQCNASTSPWIQTTGDVHSNTGIDASGGPP